MTYKQEPCPLCGRNMTAIETHPGRGELYCDHCDLTIGGNDAKTPEELIALMDGSEHRRLKDENAKLREELAKWEQLAAGIDLPEYPVTQFEPKDLERENAKLRELCKDMMAFVEDDDACEHCGHDAECVEAADGELVLPYDGQCLMLDLFADRMRELGAEVEHE